MGITQNPHIPGHIPCAAGKGVLMADHVDIYRTLNINEVSAGASAALGKDDISV
jgi:hypothetical protein